MSAEDTFEIRKVYLSNIFGTIPFNIDSIDANNAHSNVLKPCRWTGESHRGCRREYMRWRFAVNPLHNCKFATASRRSQFEQFSHPTLSPFFPLHIVSLRADEIRRNELSRFYFQPQCLSSRDLSNLPRVSRPSPRSLHRVSSTSRSLPSSFRVRFTRKLERYSLSEKTARTAVLSDIRLEIARNLVRVFHEDYLVCNVSQDTSRCYENEIISPFNIIVVHLKVSLKTLFYHSEKYL